MSLLSKCDQNLLLCWKKDKMLPKFFTLPKERTQSTSVLHWLAGLSYLYTQSHLPKTKLQCNCRFMYMIEKTRYDLISSYLTTKLYILWLLCPLHHIKRKNPLTEIQILWVERNITLTGLVLLNKWMDPGKKFQVGFLAMNSKQ